VVKDKGPPTWTSFVDKPTSYPIGYRFGFVLFRSCCMTIAVWYLRIVHFDWLGSVRWFLWGLKWVS